MQCVYFVVGDATNGIQIWIYLVLGRPSFEDLV